MLNKGIEICKLHEDRSVSKYAKYVKKMVKDYAKLLQKKQSNHAKCRKKTV